MVISIVIIALDLTIRPQWVALHDLPRTTCC